MANIAIFRINYKSDFILTLNSDAGWLTPFCIKFWTDAPSQAYFVGFDGTTYTHCAPVAGEPTKLLVQFDDHHLPIGDLKFQIGYHFTVADFPTSVEDEVINQASVIIEVDGAPAKVMLDLNGETAPEIEFSLPAYANEAQRIENEQQRIENEQQRIDNEQQRIDNEQTRQRNEGTRIENEQERVREFGQMKGDLEQATRDAAAAAENANEKGVYAKNQGDYAKQQGDTAKADHERAEDDHRIAGEDHTQAGSDHTRAGEDHTQAGSDHTRAGEDHTRAGEDHTRAGEDHTRAEIDHAAVEVFVDSLGAFDISAYHATGGVLAKYADLTAALGTNGANVPDTLRKGGMSVKFVQSSDNKYVQYRLMSDSFNTTVANWQGVDTEPVDGSRNLIESGGTKKTINDVLDNVSGIINGNKFTLSGNGPYPNVGRYINGSNTPQENDNYCYSKPYKVRVGDIINVSAGSGNSGATCIMAFIKNGEVIHNITDVNNTPQVKSYTYTVTDNCDGSEVVFSATNYQPSSFEIQYNNLTNINVLKELIENLQGDIHDNILVRLDSGNTTEGYYRHANLGTIIELTGFFYSNAIPVSKGDVFHANSVSTNSAQDVIAMLAWVDENNSFISTILHPNTAGTYSYTFEKDGFVSISGYTNDRTKFNIEKPSVVNQILPIEKRIVTVESDIANDGAYSAAVVNNDNSVDGYIRAAAGSIAELNNFFYTTPIFVSKGTKFIANSISSNSAQSGIALLSLVKSNGDFISCLLNPSSAGTYTYTFNESAYISISGYGSDKSKFYIDVVSISNRVDNIDEFAYKINELTEKFDLTDKLVSLEQMPVQKVRFDFGLFGIFEKIGIIGDSMASGASVGWHEDGTRYGRDLYYYSWGQQLARMTGVDIYNFSEGGMFAKRWMQGNTERTWDANDVAGGAHSNKRQCYFIGLALNDYNVLNEEYSAGIGTTADINDSDYTQNADSYVGWYARIIQAIKSIEPNAYIFCITAPDGSAIAFNAQIRNIVEHFAGNRVYLIDLAKYFMGVVPTWLKSRDHMSAAGYLYFAYIIANYTDWIIRTNGEDFKYTALVGTDILDHDPTE